MDTENQPNEAKDSNKSIIDTLDKELKSTLDFTKMGTDHVAVWIIKMFGSMKFLIGFCLFFIFWIGWNLNLTPVLKPFDPYPFSTLGMVLSIFAIILSVSVIMNQNRRGRIEKIRQQVEFEVNVRAENEVTKVLNMLHQIHQHLGMENIEDKELEAMKAATDLKKIHETLNKVADNSEPFFGV